MTAIIGMAGGKRTGHDHHHLKEYEELFHALKIKPLTTTGRYFIVSALQLITRNLHFFAH